MRGRWRGSAGRSFRWRQEQFGDNDEKLCTTGVNDEDWFSEWDASSANEFEVPIVSTLVTGDIFRRRPLKMNWLTAQLMASAQVFPGTLPRTCMHGTSHGAQAKCSSTSSGAMGIQPGIAASSWDSALRWYMYFNYFVRD